MSDRLRRQDRQSDDEHKLMRLAAGMMPLDDDDSGPGHDGPAPLSRRDRRRERRRERHEHDDG